MKRLLSITAVALITSSFFAPAAHAQFVWNPNVNATQAQLQAKINLGIRTGALTRNEARDLQNKMYEYSRLESSMRRNGLSFGERNRLSARLSKLSMEIQRQLSDSDRRWNNRFRNNHRPHWNR